MSFKAGGNGCEIVQAFVITESPGQGAGLRLSLAYDMVKPMAVI